MHSFSLSSCLLTSCLRRRWGDLITVPPPVSSASLNTITTDDRYRSLAFYHVCFALASSIASPTDSASFGQPEQQDCVGVAYFKRARMLIGNPLDNVRFTLDDVSVFSLMAFYLIEINRRDAAYVYLGLAVRYETLLTISIRRSSLTLHVKIALL
jgi:hypothetical protein